MPVLFIQSGHFFGPAVSDIKIKDIYQNEISFGTFTSGTLTGYSGNAHSSNVTEITVTVTFSFGTCSANESALTSDVTSSPINVVSGSNTLTIYSEKDGNYVITITVPVEVQPEETEISWDNTSTISYMPFHGTYDYGQSGSIYLKTELVNAGLIAGKISAIEFNFTGWPDETWNDQTIKMTHTTSDKFPVNSLRDYSDLYEPPEPPSFVTVKFFGGEGAGGTFSTGPNDPGPGRKENTKIEFDSDFVWDGERNILISWENRHGAFYYGGSLFGDSNSNLHGRSSSWFADEDYDTPGFEVAMAASSNTLGGRPDIKIWGIKN